MKKQIGLLIVILYSLGIFINSSYALCCCESVKSDDQVVLKHDHDHENVSNQHHHNDENVLAEPTHSEKENHCSNSPRENIQYWVMNKNLNLKLIDFKNYVSDSLSVWLAFLITNQFDNREFVFRPPVGFYALNLPLYTPQSTILRI